MIADPKLPPSATPRHDCEMNEDPSFRTDLYRGTARDYDSFRLPYPPSLIDDLRSRAGLRGTGRLLDLACGTGQIAFALSTAVDEIVALDQEAGTVAFGRAKSKILGVTNIGWQVATAEEADIPGPFDIGRDWQRFPPTSTTARSRACAFLAPPWRVRGSPVGRESVRGDQRLARGPARRHG